MTGVQIQVFFSSERLIAVERRREFFEGNAHEPEEYSIFCQCPREQTPDPAGVEPVTSGSTTTGLFNMALALL